MWCILAMTKVSESYINGILEARQVYKMTPKEKLQEVAKDELAFINRVSYLSGSTLHSEFLKGMKDFWKKELKK